MSRSTLNRVQNALASAALGWGLLLAGDAGIASAQNMSTRQGPPHEPSQGPASHARTAVSNDLRPGERVLNITAPRLEVSIVELHSRVVELNSKIKFVEDFNPDVLSVTALSANQLRLRAEAPGVTTVRLTDEDDRIHILEVFIEKDVRELQANINRLFPGAAVEVIGVRDSIILRGWVTKPDQIPQIVQVAGTYSGDIQNHITVGAGNLIQLSVKVMEVQRSKLEQYGFNFLQIGQNHAIGSTVGGLVPIAAATATPGAVPTLVPSAGALGNPSLQLAVVGNSDSFQAFFDLLKQESLLKILATPTVTTTSGRPATIHSGGQFPLLVPQGIGTATIDYKDFGVRMEAVPIVLSRGRVQLDISASVSDRDFSNSVDVNGLRVPGITSRDVNTRVELNFGETLMIGGLISTRHTVSTNKVPVLGDIPVIGAAFSRKNMQWAETELVILVTPNLAGPMRPDQIPANGPGLNSDVPTSHELAWDGHVEVPRFSPPGGHGQYAVDDPRCLTPDRRYQAGGQEYGPTESHVPSQQFAPPSDPQYFNQQPVGNSPGAYSPPPTPAPTYAEPEGGAITPTGYRSTTGIRRNTTPGDPRYATPPQSDPWATTRPSMNERRNPAVDSPSQQPPTRPTPRFVGN